MQSKVVDRIEAITFQKQASMYMGDWLKKKPLELNMFSGCTALGFLQKEDTNQISQWMQTNFAQFSHSCFKVLTENLLEGTPVTMMLRKTISENIKLNLPWMTTDCINVSRTISANMISYRLWLEILGRINYCQKQLRQKKPSRTYIALMRDFIQHGYFFLADFLLFQDRRPLITLEILRTQCTNPLGVKWLIHHESCIQERIKSYGFPIDFLDEQELARRTIHTSPKKKNLPPFEREKTEEKNALLKFAQKKNALQTCSFFSSQEKKDFNQEINQLSISTERSSDQILDILIEYVIEPDMPFKIISPKLIPPNQLNQYKHLLIYLLYTAMDLLRVQKAASVYTTLSAVQGRDTGLSSLLQFRYGTEMMTQLMKALQSSKGDDKSHSKEDDVLQGDEVFRPWS